MKVTIKTLILVLVFALVSMMAVSAISESDTDKVTESIATLTNIQSDLKGSRSTRSIARLINSAIRIFTRAISNPNPSCPRRVEVSLLKLDRAADSLAKRDCDVSNRKNCIQGEVLDQILPNLQGAFEDLNQISLLDENNNGVPDICESDPDGDGVAGKKDNCPLTSNPDQKDVDRDGVGDACDLFHCCEDSSLTVPLDSCPMKTIKTCSQEGNVVVGCLTPLKRGGKKGKNAGDSTTSSTSLTQVIIDPTNPDSFNFGTPSAPINIMTGFVPFDMSEGVLQGFNDFNCQDLGIVFTPPSDFPGGTFEVGPAANGFETGSRSSVQINGQQPTIVMLFNFPTIDPITGQPFDPQMGDQLGLSLFVPQDQEQFFVDSFFDVFVDLDFEGNCLAPLSTSSSGGTVTTSGGTTAATSSGIAGMVFGTSSSGSLQDALNMTSVPVNMGGMAYMAGTYDCDDFANDLEQELQGMGFDATFTAIWRNGGMTGHAVTDVHTSSGGIIFIEPQNGMVINLDENMDGMVGHFTGMHQGTFMASEGMTHIEVYMTRADAAMAGAPID